MPICVSGLHTLKLRMRKTEEVTVFKHLGYFALHRSQEVKCSIALANEAFNRRKRLLCEPLVIKLRKRKVKCFV